MVRVNDVSRDGRFFEGVDFSTGHRTRSLLALPLRNLHGENIGVFEVLNKASGIFTDDDAELARLLASQMSIALETTQLLGAMRRDRDALAAANAQLCKELHGRRDGPQILGASKHIATLGAEVPTATSLDLFSGRGSVMFFWGVLALVVVLLLVIVARLLPKPEAEKPAK